MRGNGSCFITNSSDIVESLSYSGGNNYTGCSNILNFCSQNCNFAGVCLFINACSMGYTQLSNIYDVTLVTNMYEHLSYSLVAGL
jgi:hypothetical protein